MTIKLNINLKSIKRDFLIDTTMNGVESMSIADVKADFTIMINENKRIFNVSLYIFRDSGRFLYSDLDYASTDRDYSIYNELCNMKLSANNESEILCELEDELINLCDNNKENSILEIEV